MKLPKARITLDIEQELLMWVMEQMEDTGKSRNEVIGDAVEFYKNQKEEKK